MMWTTPGLRASRTALSRMFKRRSFLDTEQPALQSTAPWLLLKSGMPLAMSFASPRLDMRWWSILEVLHPSSMANILASQELHDVLGSREHPQVMGPPIRMEVWPSSERTESVEISSITPSFG
jgi:hypothetical protein